MDNNSQNNGILPANEDKTPNTRASSECSPDLNLNLFKALFPYADLSDGLDIALSDARSFIIDRVMGQVQLIQDLANKIPYSEDLDGEALAFTAESINRQLVVLNVVNDEYYKQVAKQKKELERLGDVEEELKAMLRLIDKLKRQNIALKGGVS
jgi:DNA anti-recombination protein RmuC